MNSGYESGLNICFMLFLSCKFFIAAYYFHHQNRNLNSSDFIIKAVRYGQSLIKKPKKCIMVIISDFYEGRPESDLTKAIRNVLEGGTKILGIASLGYQGEPFYNRKYAKTLQKLGVDVIASTPK